MKAKVSAVAALLFLLGRPPPLAQTSDLELRRMEARQALVEGLESYAEWCRGRHLFLERKRVLEQLLEFEPGHGAALRALGYTKDAAGKWVPPKKPKEFKDHDPEALTEAPPRYARAVEPYVAFMSALLEEQGEQAFSAEERKAIVAEVLVVDPDNARLRAERGEIQWNGRWVLAETAAANVRRDELQRCIQTASAEVKETGRVDPTQREVSWPLDWTAVVATEEARFLGTVAEEELLRVAKALHVACVLFREAFRRDASLPKNTSVFLLRGAEERELFLGAHPSLAAADREELSGLAGTWIHGANDMAYWAELEETRIDGVLRLALARLLGDAFGLSLEHAWIHEGFGLYLTEAVLGTRLTWFSGPKETTEMYTRLLVSSDWMKEAATVLALAERPRFELLAKKKLHELDSADVLYAYVLGAYWIEGRSGEVARLLRRIGTGREACAALDEIAFLQAAELDERALQWVEELGSVPFNPATLSSTPEEDR